MRPHERQEAQRELRKAIIHMLTDEQRSLYTSNAVFKAHLDQFCEQTIPVFLDGIQVRAQEHATKVHEALENLKKERVPWDGNEATL